MLVLSTVRHRASVGVCAGALMALIACGDDGGGGPPAIDAGLVADLHIKQAQTTVTVDTQLVFTIVVENLGPDAVIDAGLHTVLPPGISVVSATCAAAGAAVCGGTSTAGGASWTGLDVPVAFNDSNTVTLTVNAVPTRLGPATVAAELDVPASIHDPDTSADSNQAMRPIDRKVAQLSSSGGRVDWFHGTGTSSAAARPIAFDRPPMAAPGTTELYLMNPDSPAAPTCVSCGATFPRALGYVGNPSWYPNGEYLVMQVENARSPHASYNAPGWGLDNDLWIMRADGSWAARIWTSTGVHHGALHPMFSPDGSLLIFAERIATASAGPATMWPGTDGQDPYRGWALRVARVDPSVLGMPQFENQDAPFLVESVRLAVNEGAALPAGTAGNGRYEASAISDTGVIDYAFTPPPSAGRSNNQYVDASFTCTLSSTTALTGGICGGVTGLAGADAETWDDLAQHTPDGTHRSFPSSRADATWRAQASSSMLSTLRTELYSMPIADESAAAALTSMNATRDPANRYVIGDHEWSTDGGRVVFEVTPIAVATGQARTPEVWVVEVP